MKHLLVKNLSLKRFIVFVLTLAILTTSGNVFAETASNPSNETPLPSVLNGKSYASLGPVISSHVPDSPIVIPASSYSDAQGVSVSDGYLDYSGDVVIVDDGYVTYSVNVPKDGRYCMLLSYAALSGSRADLELNVEIDGEVPFREAYVFNFSRSWRYTDLERSFDNKGNMLRPSSSEELMWRDAYFEDKEGYYTDPFAFFLSAGTHEITIHAVREPVALRTVSLTPPPSPPSYAELSAGYNASDIANAQPVTVLAIDSSLRSDPSMLPQVEVTNPYLEPFSLTNISYNIMGGDIWCIPGQSIAWELDIPSDGLYALNFVYKQDAVLGLPVTRTLHVDGEIPFAEAKAVVFPYGAEWQRMTVSAGDEEALIYLTKGVHEISLTVTLGPTADICRRVSDISSELSAIYTQIVMITGPNPDSMRDYRIDSRLPNIIPDFDSIAKRLDQVTEDLTTIGAGRNDALSISIMASQLHDFVKKPDSIPGRLGRFKDNIVNLSIWVLTSSEMPMSLYSVTAAAPDTKFDAVHPGFFQSFVFSIRRFFSSFTARAELAGNSYSSNEEHVIEVWGSYGKDFSELLKRLCDEDFTPKTGIKVNYNIISSENSMFFNIAAKTGPDVCLNVSRGYPLDFGLRDTAVDISVLPGYEEFTTRFSQTAMVPNSYEGKVYGFPVTQTVPVMYVRTDIFEDLGLEIPQTWDDFYSIIGALGVKNLQVSPSGDLMTLFVQQNGGKYFTDDLKTCILDSPIGIAALTEWTNLFTLHGAPVVSDFFNRFRTGEMPIGIGDISLYNMLNYAALEIKGAWTMALVPGTLLEDGTINRTITTGGNSGFITKSRPERLDDSWTFVNWFLTEEIQARFCQEIESMFGASARYNTAVISAHSSVAWDKNSYDTLMASLSNVNEIAGVPGGYFIGRHVSNAFNEIVLKGESPRASIIKYTEVINSEMERKRRELRLE